MTISVIGLGKLGTPLLAVLAGAHYSVIGVDTDPDKVAAINTGRSPVQEPGVQTLMDGNRYLYKATTDIKDAILHSGTTFIIVPTPSGPDGGFTLEYLTPVMENIGAALKEKATYHLLILVSTVMPGQTQQCAHILETTSGKAEGVDFGLVYSPEFIALGSVVHDIQHPDYVLIGTEHDDAGDRAKAIYARFVSDGTPFAHMNWVNAEIAKIAQNAYITMKITFANELGQLCQHIPGANVDAVAGALGLDRRIGKHYLKAGTAFGGPCFPRDNRALIEVARSVDAFLPLSEKVDRQNQKARDRLVSCVYDKMRVPVTVGVLGLSYKPGTPVCEESASIDLLMWLSTHSTVQLIVYDPLVMDEARSVLGDAVKYAPDAISCVEASDVVVLMHPAFPLVPYTAFKDKILIDPWRVYYGRAFECKQYIPLGIGPEKEAVEA